MKVKGLNEQDTIKLEAELKERNISYKCDYVGFHTDQPCYDFEIEAPKTEVEHIILEMFLPNL